MSKARPNTPHPLDIALGQRLKQVRRGANPDDHVTMQIVAREAGVSAVQIAKYESAQDRVSFSRLCEIAAALNISVIDLIRPIVEKPRKS